ncbi:7282_t:CDS:2, partial [Funneliformis geosporum]
DQGHGNSLRCNEAQNSNNILQIGKDHQAHHGHKKPLADILAKSKFSAKLAGLSRFTTGKQLIEIGHMLNATAWIIPKARSNYLLL